MQSQVCCRGLDQTTVQLLFNVSFTCMIKSGRTWQDSGCEGYLEPDASDLKDHGGVVWRLVTEVIAWEGGPM